MLPLRAPQQAASSQLYYRAAPKPETYDSTPWKCVWRNGGGSAAAEAAAVLLLTYIRILSRTGIAGHGRAPLSSFSHGLPENM